jgi:hypothetical protein
MKMRTVEKREGEYVKNFIGIYIWLKFRVGEEENRLLKGIRMSYQVNNIYFKPRKRFLDTINPQFFLAFSWR